MNRIVGRAANDGSFFLGVHRGSSKGALKFNRVNISRANHFINVSLTGVLSQRARHGRTIVVRSFGAVRRLVRVRYVIFSINNSAPRSPVPRHTVGLTNGLQLRSAALIITRLKPQVERRNPCFDSQTVHHNFRRLEDISLHSTRVNRTLLTYRRRNVHRTQVVSLGHRRIRVKIFDDNHGGIFPLTNASFRGREVSVTPRVHSVHPVRRRVTSRVGQPLTHISFRRVHVYVNVPYALRTYIRPNKAARRKRRLTPVRNEALTDVDPLFVLHF